MRHRAPLGAVRSFGSPTSAEFSVGLRRGRVAAGEVAPDRHQPDIRPRASCKSAPKYIAMDSLQRCFAGLLRHHLGVGLTQWRTLGEYRGRAEPSAVTRVFAEGMPVERFQHGAKKIAAELARRLCQDEVYVELQHGDGRRETFSATAPKGTTAPRANKHCTMKEMSRDEYRQHMGRSHTPMWGARLGSPLGMSLDIRSIRRTAEAQGWRVEQTRGSHLAFYSPNRRCPPVYASGTPGDQRAVKNLLADLRRCGLETR